MWRGGSVRDVAGRCVTWRVDASHGFNEAARRPPRWLRVRACVTRSRVARRLARQLVSVSGGDVARVLGRRGVARRARGHAGGAVRAPVALLAHPVAVVDRRAGAAPAVGHLAAAGALVQVHTGAGGREEQRLLAVRLVRGPRAVLHDLVGVRPRARPRARRDELVAPRALALVEPQVRAAAARHGRADQRHDVARRGADYGERRRGARRRDARRRARRRRARWRAGRRDATPQELVEHTHAVRRKAHVQAAAALRAFDQQLADLGELRGRHGLIVAPIDQSARSTGEGVREGARSGGSGRVTLHVITVARRT